MTTLAAAGTLAAVVALTHGGHDQPKKPVRQLERPRVRFAHKLNHTRRTFEHRGLRHSVKLESLCQGKTNSMARRRHLDHAGFHARAAAANLTRVNESVSYQYGSASAKGTLRQFMGSPEHRANMLSAGTDRVGVAATRRGRVVYWCVLIGG